MNLIAYDGQIELDEDDWADEYELDEDEEDEWECAFGADCVNPHYFHQRADCYTADMVESWQEEN